MVSQPPPEPLRPGLELLDDGSLVLMYASRRPEGFPEMNWFSDLQRQKCQLTFRFYGPSKDVIVGTYLPTHSLKAPARRRNPTTLQCQPLTKSDNK
jgi:hypothetical protein